MSNKVAGVFRSIMKAIRVNQFGGPEVLKLQSDLPIPKPSAGQVLIKIGAAGVNPVETYLRAGAYAKLPGLPWTPGNDSAGIVQEVGSGVTDIKAGDRVFTKGTLTGSYAEYAVADSSCVFGLHDGLDFKQGAALGIPYFTAYRALVHRARARAGMTVLVHGASGTVGIASVQFARAYGMTVLGTAGSEQGMSLVSQIGAHHVFNHRQEGYIEKITEATGGRGVDVVIEMLANVNLQRDLEILAPRGTVAVVGNRGNIEINPRLTMGKESSIVGVMGAIITEADKRETNAAMQAGMESGWLKPFVGKEYPLKDAAVAHEDIIKTTSALGRIVLVP
ncbi:quinone oxidoreductase-like [Patiria miniata]|uniref:Enoyl reductase (ER) domain-containing protein n=1 Tax=Patiria miniata TaxID=46514 RepID=A0A913Z3J2_PATMI|nr:quinone oxidoreductase-like [Patiria miniata]